MERLQEILTEGREAYARGEFAAAERLFSQAIEGGAQKYADVHHALGVIYHSWGLYPKARAAFELALEINPKYTEAALNLSITYNDLGRYAESKELLAKFGDDGEGPAHELTRAKIANLHAEVGDAYRSAGMGDEAIAEYERALQLRPHFVDIRTRLAQTLSERHQLDRAKAELERALADKPQYVPALLQLGLFHMGKNDRSAAAATFRRVLEVQPGHERAESYLRMLETSKSSE